MDEPSRAKIGVLGGTFDPIHYAHLFIAEEARVRLGLARVLFVPNRVPPHKRSIPVSEAEHRRSMVELALAGNAGFTVSTVELDRPGPSFAVDTLTELSARNPGAELYFLIGFDAVAEILTWKRWEEVVQLARFVAIARPGLTAETFDDRIPAPVRGRIQVLEGLNLDISSTELRERVSAGLPIRYLTPDAVVDYIREHRLYLAPDPES